MPKFNVGDKIELINGSIGTVTPGIYWVVSAEDAAPGNQTIEISLTENGSPITPTGSISGNPLFIGVNQKSLWYAFPLDDAFDGTFNIRWRTLTFEQWSNLRFEKWQTMEF